MTRKIITLLFASLVATMAHASTATAQERVHGFAVNTTAAIGTSWKTTRYTPLWPYPQDSGFNALRNIPRGTLLRAVTGFKSSATGIYIRVRYNNVTGWVDERDIRRATIINRPPLQTINVAPGVRYQITNVNNWASLRQAVSTQSVRLARIPYGDFVVTTGKKVLSGGLTWLSVSYQGQRGWMPTRYLVRSGPVVQNPNVPQQPAVFPIGNYRIVNVNNWASLRAWASRSADRISTVPRDRVVYFNGQRQFVNGETWLRVQFGNLTGWMPVQYLRVN